MEKFHNKEKPTSLYDMLTEQYTGYLLCSLTVEVALDFDPYLENTSVSIALSLTFNLHKVALTNVNYTPYLIHHTESEQEQQ